MIEVPRGLEIELKSNLVLDRFVGEVCVQSVTVTSLPDGALEISSAGTSPRLSLKQLRQAQTGLETIALATQGKILIEHDHKPLAELRPLSSRKVAWKVRWFSVLREWLKSMR